SALAATGLALGVALLFGILVGNASVNREFHHLALEHTIVGGGRSTATQTSFSSFLDNLEAGLAAFSAIALFVAGFLVYLTFSSSVVERTRLFGTLRSLGATRRQIRRLVLSEFLLIAAVAGTAGLFFCVGIANVTIALFV